MSIESLSEKAKPFYVTQAEIDATHPMNDGVTCYAEDEAAMQLVGERRGKRELVDLVRTLLIRANQPQPVAQGEAVAPYAYEYWVSNGDGTRSVEFGRRLPVYHCADWGVKTLYATPTGHGVVPVEHVEAVAEVRHFNYSGIARNGFSQEVVLLDGTPIFPEGTKLYVEPAKTDGFVNVPSDPTDKMLEASAVKWTQLCHGYAPASGHAYFMRELWQAMLAAAPDAGGV